MTANEILDYLDDQIFVLDTSRRIVRTNHPARVWMAGNGITAPTPSFSEVTGRLNCASGMGGPLPGESLDVYISHAPVQAVFQMRERPMYSQSGELTGYFVTLSDVTRYRALIDQMEHMMGIDPLTGLGNRYRYNKRSAELAGSGTLLSVLVGDVNELKLINDTFGHSQGDLLLQTCARVMSEVFSPYGDIFRIGGDEFVALLPGVDHETAKLLAALLDAQLSTVTGLPKLPTMATGVATRTAPDQAMEEIARIADLSMYANKRSDRRKGPADRRRAQSRKEASEMPKSQTA